jgi:hypothetical protein
MANPIKYREEVERLRKEAAATTDAEARRTMIEIAALYERLANTLARQRGPKADP